MKITLPPDLLDELFETNEESEVADALINEGYFALSDEELLAVPKALQKGLEPSDAYKKALLPLLDEGGKEALARVQVGYGLDEIKPLTAQDYRENPYYQRVCSKISKKMKIGAWTLEMKNYRSFELFVYADVLPSYATPFASYSPLGYFPGGFPYPALSQNGTTYMSLIPHEINTMKEPISRAKGSVCTMGLGMGYFAFMASQKEEVSSVTVLERDEAVISLFRSFFLPLFDHPEKIRIVKVQDALEYIPEEPFDYLFADLHHDATDGLPLYISLLKKEGLAEKMDVWIEGAILAYLRRYLIALMEEESDGSSDKDYQSEETFPDHLFKALHFHLKNYEVSDLDSLLYLLSDAQLKAIVKEMKF